VGESVFDNQNGFEYWSAPKTQLAALLGFIGLSLLAGIASASVTATNMHGWFTTLTAPPLTPPSSALPVEWSVLAVFYVMTAVAAWLVWRRLTPAPLQRSALTLWGWQLALSAAWPAAFFGLHYVWLGLLIGAALVLILAVAIRQFSRLDKNAALLMAPYFAWVAFTCYLNAGFWWLNQ
jgi:tryptophan-rich sensory protein